MKLLPFFIFFLVFSILCNAQKTVKYDLYVTDTIVNYTGKDKKAAFALLEAMNFPFSKKINKKEIN